ncbi:hypothetical protein MTR67_043225 [Solanum verrucosum]|uniref:Reverse transcriptase RNase H-like domain-containing protein n=1 Tax=Solanum verrucosum TaxID=315347 RepID=A0AAF0UNP8_SOLVR|nr:hypothetical protein MTR67_043225 [Solanum verrucosum]
MYIAFLGHIFSGGGIQVDPKKTAAIKNWPRRLSSLDIWSLLGLTSYYRRFLEGYYSIALPLTSLIQKKVKFLCVHVDMFTDHKSLQYVFKKKDLNLNQRIWLELLKDYNMSVIYHPSKANIVIDTLSRLSMDVKAKQNLDQVFVELKKPVSKKAIEAFSQWRGGVICYQGLCVPNVDELRSLILVEAHISQYSIHLSPRCTKICEGSAAPSQGLRPPSRPVKGTTARGGSRGPLNSGPPNLPWGLTASPTMGGTTTRSGHHGREDPRGRGWQWLGALLAALAP